MQALIHPYLGTSMILARLQACAAGLIQQACHQALCSRLDSGMSLSLCSIGPRAALTGSALVFASLADACCVLSAALNASSLHQVDFPCASD